MPRKPSVSSPEDDRESIVRGGEEFRRHCYIRHRNNNSGDHAWYIHVKFDSEDIIVVEGRISEKWKLRRHALIIDN